MRRLISSDGYYIRFKIESKFKSSEDRFTNEEFTDLKVLEEFKRLIFDFFGYLSYFKISIVWSNSSDFKVLKTFREEESIDKILEDEMIKFKEFIVKVPEFEAYKILSVIPISTNFDKSLKSKNTQILKEGSLEELHRRVERNIFEVVSHSRYLINLTNPTLKNSDGGWNPGQEEV
ncbi:expressed protein [Phakopsora pachyrhizi]|uniref:Expressed protein n=1 Tax=Phakopsora pachyrhizi TaxID=170000 RepID=A0AAV0AMR6_PHAPC|nr:expressed protein [Phakopsora pachyrhizi]